MTAYPYITPAALAHLRRDDWDPRTPVPCPQCEGRGRVTRRTTGGGEVQRKCPNPECTHGQVPAGERPESPYSLILDYTGNPTP